MVLVVAVATEMGVAVVGASAEVTLLCEFEAVSANFRRVFYLRSVAPFERLV